MILNFLNCKGIAKMSAKYVLITIIAPCFILAGAVGLQCPQWKGKIEYEDGIKIIFIKNACFSSKEGNQEAGYTRIKRYKIKNWNQIGKDYEA